MSAVSSLVRLYTVFLQIGAFSFGGGYAMLPLIERETVVTHGWISRSLFVDLIAIAQSTPGPIAVNAATFIGFQTAGLAGAIAATAGVITVPFLLVLLVYILFRQFTHVPVVSAMLAGLKPAVVALIFFSAWSVATIAIETWLAAMIALVAFGVVMSRRIHPIAVIAAGALVGVLFM